MAPKNANITLATFLMKRWLPAIKPTIREATQLNYSVHVRHHISPYLGRSRLSSITGEKLNDLYATLAIEGLAKGNGGLAPATIRRVHTTLHRAFKDAIRWGYLESNPCHAADPPKLRASAQPEMKTWTAVELATFLSAIKDHEWYEVYHLIAMTGLRRGEALGLRWSDVDLERGDLAVRQTLLQLPHGLKFSTPKTSRSARVIALDPRTVSILTSLRESRPNKSGLVFEQKNGRPLHPSEVTKHFKTLAGQAGVPRIRLHDLRHTHATLALQADVHPKIVSERLGHSTIAFTLDVYSHAIPHMQTEAAAQIAALVLGN